MIDACPLQWPQGWPRTKNPERARFGDHTHHYASRMVLDELERLGAIKVVINSNMQVRLDGAFRSGQRDPDDKGVVVYFMLNGNEQCFPCDRWDKVNHNLWAIYKSVQALRGLERWGAKSMVDAAFRGFEALPESVQVHGVAYFSDCVSYERGRERYKRLLKELHPDIGGSSDDFVQMQEQWEVFKKQQEERRIE